MANPENTKRLQLKLWVASVRASQAWEAWGHTLYHYSIVPLVFGYGLWYSDEFTLNPATLFSKIVFS
eukprot:CAMPEP_0179265034 /NCGR_PEP_ID=MMETSP0797-20121207/28696_1 /TAXON_ID=47934 /ORGANISM="Dinophysis acuminata, Strain DAEP01" /LENGTH=66 /DNA_ID=CAMNT_0020973231 /DNA_START=68 /DNA_END=268 /DNA_ORIENTATION=-